MTRLPDHNVEVGNLKIYAQGFSAEPPVQKTIWSEMEIDEGVPKYYIKRKQLRKAVFSFKMYGDVGKNRLLLETLDGKGVLFSSPYIGTFNSKIEFGVGIEDGSPNVLLVSMEAQEI